VRLLFEHGAFTREDAIATAHVLVWLALALPAHVLAKALGPAFFAREDTATPLKASAGGLVVTIVAAFLFDRLFGASGIAGAIALGAWSNAISLIRHATVSFGFSLLPATRGRLVRIAAAALAMAGLLWLATYLPALNTPAHGFAQALVVTLLIAGAIAIYLLLLVLLGVAGWRQTVAAIRPEKPHDLHS
jgi:putative peptidoglycan lipid II flippase